MLKYYLVYKNDRFKSLLVDLPVNPQTALLDCRAHRGVLPQVDKYDRSKHRRKMLSKNEMLKKRLETTISETVCLGNTEKTPRRAAQLPEQLYARPCPGRTVRFRR